MTSPARPPLHPAHPWDEITGGLWMGSGAAAPDGTFDVVITLDSSVARHKPLAPPRDATHLIWPIRDTTIPNEAVLHETVEFICDSLDQGVNVLVRCMAGMSRSGLVCALTLVARGATGPEAVATIRDRRHPDALGNATFERYVTGYEPGA